MYIVHCTCIQFMWPGWIYIIKSKKTPCMFIPVVFDCHPYHSALAGHERLTAFCCLLSQCPHWGETKKKDKNQCTAMKVLLGVHTEGKPKKGQKPMHSHEKSCRILLSAQRNKFLWSKIGVTSLCSWCNVAAYPLIKFTFRKAAQWMLLAGDNKSIEAKKLSAIYQQHRLGRMNTHNYQNISSESSFFKNEINS